MSATPDRIDSALWGRPPGAARLLLLVLLALTGLSAQLPLLEGSTGTGLAVGSGAVVLVLSAVWLGTVGRLACCSALALLTLDVPAVLAAPAPEQLLPVAVALAGTALAAALVARLGRLVTESSTSRLRSLQVRDDLARTSEVQQRELTARVQHVSTHDPLTGLVNRPAFLALVDDALAARTSTGVLVLSIAEFGPVNDSIGAHVGDVLLAAVGARLASVSRDTDVVSRLGGDEFGVLLRGLNVDSAGQVGARLVGVLDEAFGVGSHTVPLRARAGLALDLADGAPEPGRGHELLRRAEVASRRATPGGRLQLFRDDDEADDVARLQLEADLHRGLEAGEFFLLYQPLVSTETGRIESVEALVRWRHPERGLVPPDAFIGAAERTGLIVPLGSLVLEMACAQLRAWSATAPALTVAVNVSARQLVAEGFVEDVRRLLWGTGVDPHQVVLELTESLLVEDSEAEMAVLWQLRGLGVRLALDDFGTGYSSLGRLGDLPLDELKIDKSFVDRLGASPGDSSTLITAAIAMGHGLGLAVVAEGVETAAQATFLRAGGCDLLQGYLLGRPQSPDDIAGLLGAPLLALAEDVPAPRPADGPVVTVPRLMPELPSAGRVRR